MDLLLDTPAGAHKCSSLATSPTYPCVRLFEQPFLASLMTAVCRRSLSGPACRPRYLGYILRSPCLFRPPDPMHSRRSSRRSQPMICDEYLLSKLTYRFLVTCIERGLLKVACSLVRAPDSSRLAAAEAEIERYSIEMIKGWHTVIPGSLYTSVEWNTQTCRV